MMEDNERLLQQFFSEAANQQIADNGFTARVMQRVEAERAMQSKAERVMQSKAERQTASAWQPLFSRLWTPFCIAVFAVLFVVFRGWEMLAVQLEVMVRTMAAQPFSINVLMLFSVVFGLLLVGTGEVISSEIARR